MTLPLRFHQLTQDMLDRAYRKEMGRLLVERQGIQARGTIPTEYAPGYFKSQARALYLLDRAGNTRQVERVFDDYAKWTGRITVREQNRIRPPVRH